MSRPAPALRRHLLLLVLFSSIPAFALVGINSWKEYAHLRDMAAERAMAVANTVVHEQSELIFQTRELLSALAALPYVSSRSDAEACSRELGRFIGLSNAYENIGVAAADGALICSAKPLSQMVNVAGMPYFRRTLEARTFVVGNYHISRATGRPVFTMSMPTPGTDGESTGVIFAAVSTDWLEHAASAITLPPKHALTVLDSAFNVLARLPADQWVGKNVADSPLAAYLQSVASEGTAEIAGLSGELRSIAYVPLHAGQGGDRIFVVVGAPTAEIYGEARITLLKNLIGLFLALSAVALGAWFEADHLVLRHIDNLIGAISRLKSGQSDARVAPGRGSRELVVLGQAFNDMASELQERDAARKSAEAAILQAELRYRTLFEQSPVGIVVIDLDTGLALECNAVAHDTLGYTKAEFMRLRISDYEAVESPEQIKEHTQRILRQGGDRFETQHRTKTGELRDVNIVMRVLNFGERRYLHCIYQDITEQRRAAIALQRANRALRTLSAANEELVRATSEVELLARVCRAIVVNGGFNAASVGYAQDDPGKSIKPMAWTGLNDSYIAGHVQTWAETEMGQRPISRAIRSGKPEVARNILTDPSFAHWKEDAIKYGFLSNIALPISDGTRTIGALNIYATEPDAFDTDEIHLLEELADDLSYGIATLRTRAERDRIAYAHAHHEETLRKSLEDSIAAIAATVEMRDPYTAGHERRVGELAAAIAREMGLAEDRIHGLRLAASIHDLGKINVPAEILAKPGKLTRIEYLLIKTHAQAGYEILKDIEFPWPIAAMVRQHHERLDGSGYPQGLKDGDILLEARIMAVADVVEAMASHRPYRPSLGIQAALAEIERGRAAAYDPAAVDACLRLFRAGRFAFAT